MEWGPRALGNRSILARATERGINERLNKRLGRTEYMPFAPSIKGYRAAGYLQDWKIDHLGAKYMTITYDVVPAMIPEVPGVVHIDGTTRPHAVFEEDNPSFHKILREYEKLSGIPLIINTSFNMHEEPIVCTPQDALRAFDEGACDVLAIGNYLVTK